MNNGNHYDAIVIGGGPAGSTAASLLAMKGRRVVLLEKAKFPRYHIGESLLPHAYFPLQRLGLLDKMKASHFTKKYSVQFVTPKGKLSVPFYFNEHTTHESAMTWQVLRSEFDQMLLDNTREKGAEVIEEIHAKELLRNEAGTVTGVKAVDNSGATREFHATMTIDATGRDAFSVRSNNWMVRDPYLNKMAVWTYYKGALRDPGIDEGATTVAYVPEKGWFWYIPLADDILSVGVVAEKNYLFDESTDPATVFHREVKKNPWIEQHLAPGKQFGEYRVTGEYSYRSRHCAADGLVLAGDAFGFLDPVFSSGVFLALRSGEMVADIVDEALTDGDISGARFANYGKQVCYGIESMRKLVYAFYNENFSFREFLQENPTMKGDITDCLIGNLFIDFDPLFNAMSKFAAVPPPVSHGAPLVREASSQNACV